MNTTVKALVLTGFGLNCDYETDYSLRQAGADSRRIHINDLIPDAGGRAAHDLDDYHILVFGGGFSWGDDHGAGVLLASRMRTHLGERISRFIADGKLVLAICNGFQAVVNLGLLPGLDGDYTKREVALINNDCGNFRDDWTRLAINRDSKCVFTRDMESIELPIRHGEGKFYADDSLLDRLSRDNRIVFRYAGPDMKPARGAFPFNPNGSLMDIAGICDPTGRVMGLMPHPEAFNHWTNHPNWTQKERGLKLSNVSDRIREGEGMKIFRNGVRYIRETLLKA
jgi:phosphoribosylformylglycinamidine synthase subunit PurQ / glutaminase